MGDLEMELKELVQAVSDSTGVAPDSVRKVLDAAFIVVNKEMGGEEAVKLQGLGTFMRKPGKDQGDSRVVFRPWLNKEQREAKKKKRLAKKSEAAAG
jgi:hypothetical protein